jgi:hypothetical protein
MGDGAAPRLAPQVRGWLRYLWRKATTPDDWSRGGEPHPWWDRSSMAPMLSFPRFDLSESSYAFLLLARKTPAWREVYTRILDELLRRHTTWWAAVDWLTQIGPDPDRARYPRKYKALIPKDLWGHYDVPGWTANGVAPWGLQPDPIGATGNLFFRGFLNLMLAIHRAVSGEATWDRPFEMAGLDDRTFAWTHRGIADYLSGQWAETPHGPHCENTKSWPFCLSAAGLGLQLTDRTLGTGTHWVYERWVEDMFKKRYMGFDARGNLRWVALYYDSILDRVHGNNRILGLYPAIYVAPQDRKLGELLYRNAVAALGWDKRYLPVFYPLRDPRGLTLGLLLAREYGDATTARRLAKKLARIEHGRFFDAEGGAGEDEFGHFFRYGERYPRGQESALYLLKDLLDGEGDWARAFEPDLEKFAAPTVTDCDYPRMGFSVAWNDLERGVLELESYAATTSARGEATRFRVRNLSEAARVRVTRDGSDYAAWRALGPDAIEVETRIGAHRYEIWTGHRGGAAARAHAGRPGAQEATAARAAAPREPTRPVEIASALAAAASGAGGCPCCAGGAA